MIPKIVTFCTLFTLIILASCQPSKNKIMYFGGEIINPKTNYVVLLEKETPIDTLYLSSNNRFLAKLENKEEGLYYFKHADEYQYIYLAQSDSLLIRLNTLNFDESLVFSGKGAERNNFLIDCFIDSEKDTKDFYEYYKLNPKKFMQILDSLEAIKLKKFDEFYVRNSNETEQCNAFLKIALTYPLYSKIENYPLAHARILKKKSFVGTDDNFYEHRKNINVNNESLIYYSVYSNFLTNYLYNKTYASGFSPETKDYSPEFTNTLLKVTDKNIDSKIIKNILFKQEIKYHFFRNSESSINEALFKTYFSLNTNKEFEDEIKNVLDDLNKIKNGHRLLDFKVFDYTHNLHNIKDMVHGKNTFLYFWNPKYISENFISSRIDYLATENTKVQFIGIRIDGDSENFIKNLDVKNQYYINNTSDAHLFLSSKLPRVILIDNKGIITNSYASLSSKKIYTQVNDLNKTN